MKPSEYAFPKFVLCFLWDAKGSAALCVSILFSENFLGAAATGFLAAPAAPAPAFLGAAAAAAGAGAGLGCLTTLGRSISYSIAHSPLLLPMSDLFFTLLVYSYASYLLSTPLLRTPSCFLLPSA
mmetsp:Transcript_45145/g.116786  ORF Transcript_45145/g.116786 Transcript_45145/m.116786 type:complete len:125 (-) Transcript_45145:235-609(-)